ncbi:MAG: hypothetical protein H6620_10470 [Halobacteriovoraceae bacterium]|nr:hypothetical protein [Halobacteriovoraceae bacterium]
MESRKIKSYTQERSDWAIDLMKLGHNSESIILLAGISPPYDKFELRDLVDDVFRDLKIQKMDIDQAVKDYLSYFSKSVLSKEVGLRYALEHLQELYYELDRHEALEDFSQLAWCAADFYDRDEVYSYELNGGCFREDFEEKTFDLFRSVCKVSES